MISFVRLRIAAVISGAAILVSACAGSQGGNPGTGPISTDASQQRMTSDAPSSFVPALAVGRTWQVQSGASTLDQAVQALDFYNHAIVIDAGDSVTWRIAAREPHTIAFLAPGQKPPAALSPQAVAPAGGNVVDGTTYINSGLLNDGQTFTLHFPKPGTYVYLCLLHQPEMTGKIVVQNAGAAYPHSQDYYTQSAIPDEWADLNAGGASVHAFPYAPKGTTLAAGISPGLAAGKPTESTVSRFLTTTSSSRVDQNLAVKVGTTITWVNQSNNAPHTVTLPVAGQPLPATLSPFAPRIGGAIYDGTHLVNSGILLAGQKYSLTFTKAGEFHYYCLFHDDQGMQGIISVVK